MPSVTELLDRKNKPRNGGRQHRPSSDGTHKWETNASIANYRKARDKKNKAEKKDRKRNR